MKLRIILTVLSLLALLSVCTTGYLYYSSLRDTAYNEANKQAALHAETAKNHISYLLSENLKTVKVFAGLKELREVLIKKDPGSLAKVNAILDHFNESLNMDVCYLMDRDGNTIASSNRNAPDSFVGKNYAFRPYFQQSINGAPGIYMALGVTSKKRGAYYSHPIYDEDEKTLIGVAVIKASIDPIEKDLNAEQESIALLTDPNGIIFLSNRKDWLFQALWELPSEKLSQIALSKQFGEGPFYWTGLQKKEGAGATDRSGNPYLVRQIELDNYPGWNIVFLRSLKSISESVSNQLMRTAGPLIWILCVLIGFLVFYLYWKASHEIIQRKTAEKALRESEERYRQIVNSANDFIYRTTADGYFTFSNPTAMKTIEYSMEELIGKHYLELIPADYREEVERFYGLQFVKKIPNTYYELPIITRSGGEKWLGQNVQLVMEGDRIVGFQAVARDITDRKQAEEALRESEERFRKFADEASFDGIIIHDEGQILDVNEIFAEMYGYKRPELIGMDALETVAPETREVVRKNIREKYEKPYQAAGLRKDGSAFPIEIRAKTIPYQGRQVRVASVHDMTDRKRAEEEKEKLQSHLQQAQKMEAIATLAGGIAHQFNNALSVITGNLELLKLDLPNHASLGKYTKPMASSADRMSQLTSQLLAYARGGKYQVKTISLSDFVKNTLPLIEHALKPSINIETYLSPDILNVKADLTQLQIVVSAIVSNASEAIQGAGRIRISCRNEEITEERVKDYPGLDPGRYAALIIEDNGKGMDQETRSRIFEPFFTTKFQGRGLGMAAVYGIIKKHGGLISIDSALDHGTVVRIYLPAIEEKVEAPKESRKKPLKGTGTILVIEDEGMLMHIIQDFLKRSGYRVLEAKTGMEAIHIVQNYNDHIDLAVLDIVLPDMEGKTIYPLLMEARPGLKVIVCSGYSIDGPAQDILDAGAQGFIQKPFSPAALSEKIKEVLD